ncbi:MAG TPA: hypothetical protein VH331_07335 [Allosphingosinicella sp.]|nr:hypothetical protein [Allosphingosinicella sp.]
MRLALTVPAPPDTPHPPLRQRAASFVLAVTATLLMILVLWTLNGRAPERPRFKGSPVMLDFKPDADSADTTKKQAAKPEPRKEAEVRPQPPAPPKPVPPPPAPPLLPVVHPYYIPLTREENDTADISKIRHPELAGAGPSSAGTQGAGGSPGDSKPIGTARDGTPLYRAQWFREPTNAELGFYLPKNKDIHGTGIVECRTIADHHVDDCVEVASSPPGSHLAGAVRQAAWQFLVRPPRLGGKELIGAWVYIQIDYDWTVTRAADNASGAPAPDY